MANILYVLSGTDPSPRGDGDTRSWFYYYKFDPSNDGEFFLPYATPAKPGDILWFVIDGMFVGCVPLLRCDDNEMDGTKELWYQGTAIREFELAYDPQSLEMVHNGELWTLINQQSCSP